MKNLILSLLVCLLWHFTQAGIIMSPYLQAVTQNSVYVLVECSTADTVTVSFGLTPSFGSSTKTESIESTTNSTVTYVHNIKLTGLQPNTLYYYKASQGASQSQVYSFKTAVPAGTSFRFVWMADCRTGTSYHDQISLLINSANPLFSLYGGDMCITGNYSDWKNEFFRANELAVISHIPFFFAPGNHEGWDQNGKAFTQSPNSASGVQDYYSFDYGDMHVLEVNTQISYSIGSAQYNFALSDLAASNKQWKVVIAHYPAYCSGGHGEDAGMIAMSQNIFVPNHVDVVFAGHSHFYQHNLVSNIHHMVIGTAGAPLYTPTNGSYTIKSVMDYNYGVIDVTPTSFHVIVYNNLNSILDTLVLTKPPEETHHEQNLLPKYYNLYQNYPNPFNPVTRISFDLPVASFTKLSIYDLEGREDAILVNGNIPAGSYSVEWSATGGGRSFPSGVYFYQLSATNRAEIFSEAKKLVLLK